MVTAQQKPTDILRHEHETVLLKLTALEKDIGRLDKRDEISAELKELAAFFETEFWTHFDKEEKALFPEFDNFMPRGAGPIAVMLEEHVVLRKTNEVMQGAIARYLNHADDAATRQTINQNGSHFIDFLRAHINKEDGILFMMADMHLNQKQNEKVVKLFQEMEKAGGD
ncbi:MAG: hemerythrin domain-containing protein [Chloroflexi bacterium]|nr:hemerythrin domain-containing protein [Chloroflexota bacterium]